MDELKESFISKLQSRTLVGYEESISILLKELNLNVEHFEYIEDKKYFFIETESVEIYAFDFKLILHSLQDVLFNITGQKLMVYKTNGGDKKWYDSKYAEFKSDLRLPESVIRQVYSDKMSLISLMNEEGYEDVVDRAIKKYSLSK